MWSRLEQVLIFVFQGLMRGAWDKAGRKFAEEIAEQAGVDLPPDVIGPPQPPGQLKGGTTNGVAKQVTGTTHKQRPVATPPAPEPYVSPAPSTSDNHQPSDGPPLPPRRPRGRPPGSGKKPEGQQ